MFNDCLKSVSGLYRCVDTIGCLYDKAFFPRQCVLVLIFPVLAISHTFVTGGQLQISILGAMVTYLFVGEHKELRCARGIGI